MEVFNILLYVLNFVYWIMSGFGFGLRFENLFDLSFKKF